MAIINGCKKCARCGALKGVDGFGKSSQTKDGLYWCCRDCNSEQKRAHYEKNRERIITQTSQYHRDHPEVNRAAAARYNKTDKRAESLAIWNAENKDRLTEYARRYRNKHREYYRAYRRQHYRVNEAKPEVRELRRARMRRMYTANPEAAHERGRLYRARKFGSGGQHSNFEWRAMLDWFGGKCLCCGRTDRIQRDHVIPISRGGGDDISNIQPLCGGIDGCNQRKFTNTTDYRDPDLLLSFLEWADTTRST